MPTWGLTSEQRELRPWGISPELLLPSKTLTDPVHGDVYLTVLESYLVDSPPMQRLRRVRQLGTTHVIYPGATHSRLSHALGTLRAAQDLLDAVWNSRSNPQAKSFPRNLMAEWEAEGKLETEFAKATVLARLGALLHDLCHVPVGHTIEDDLRVLVPHDGNNGRFKKLWKQIDPRAREAIEADPNLFDELRILVISKDTVAKTFKSDYPFVGDIVGNTICADLIDYLQRDHRNTGLPIALGRRFMDSFFVVTADHPHYPKHMVIGIERDGRIRNDIVSELLKYLRYRYELTERVLTHHAKTAADAMLGHMLNYWRDEIWITLAQKQWPELALSAEASREEGEASLKAARAGDDPKVTSKQLGQIDKKVRQELEQQFLTRSDDSLVEHLVILGSSPHASRRMKAAGALAKALLDRRLHKGIGLANGESNQAISRTVFEKFGGPRERRQLEADAAAFAGIESPDGLIIWLPEPNMRLKVADVLVHQHGTIAPLSNVEATSLDIANKHQRLWGVTVYATAEVRRSELEADAALAYLGDAMGLRFHRPDGSEVPTRSELVLDTVVSELHPNPGLKQRLHEFAVAASTEKKQTFAEMVEAVHVASVENNLISSEPST